jgi:hypothetical protein
MSTQEIDRSQALQLSANIENLLVISGGFCHYGIAHEGVPPAVLQSDYSYPQASHLAVLKSLAGMWRSKCR